MIDSQEQACQEPQVEDKTSNLVSEATQCHSASSRGQDFIRGRVDSLLPWDKLSCHKQSIREEAAPLWGAEEDFQENIIGPRPAWERSKS